MKNFLTETIEAMSSLGHKIEDVSFIKQDCSMVKISFEEFESIANFEYDDKTDPDRVETKFFIKFRGDVEMWRVDVDGRECWTGQPAFRKDTHFCVSDVGNYYGGLSVFFSNGKAFWSIEDYDGDSWTEISIELYMAICKNEGVIPHDDVLAKLGKQ